MRRSAGIEVDVKQFNTTANLSQLGGRPEWTSETVRHVLLESWGLHVARVQPLVSERDQNWDVTADSGDRFVVKVANRADSVNEVDMQQQMMWRLADRAIPSPVTIPAADGRPVVRVAEHLVWMINHLGGVTLANTVRPTPALFANVGQLIGRLSNALDDFDHPAAHRQIQWDVQHAQQVIEAYRHFVDDADNRRLLDSQLTRLHEHVAPRLLQLPRGVIHNDANDHNILVTGDAITGLIDFGDAVHSVLLNELAIPCAYAMLGRKDPLATMSQIIGGYEHVRPLADTERELLLDLVRIRLATSVSISAYQRRQLENDAYLTISEAPAWQLLNRLGTSS